MRDGFLRGSRVAGRWRSLRGCARLLRIRWWHGELHGGLEGGLHCCGRRYFLPMASVLWCTSHEPARACCARACALREDRAYLTRKAQARGTCAFLFYSSRHTTLCAAPHRATPSADCPSDRSPETLSGARSTASGGARTLSPQRSEAMGAQRAGDAAPGRAAT